ncbi:GNAT family N-acetyltransferase [Streptomyces violascens]|uniref:GNAT family N-acetyltransferase n=1 Tax=Streptomyces violascens TaxID=67381 RepID=UPI00167982C5|nr:GNAT family N-acetyltransferase [Streptomyces violascens]
MHADAHADRAHEEFVLFTWFVDQWVTGRGSRAWSSTRASEPVGFTYGAPGEPGREWWRDYLDSAPADPSTFSVSELMLRVKWRKKGLGERLRTALVDGRAEGPGRARREHDPRLQAQYEGWGYRKIGERQPFPNSPLYAVMLLDLKTAARTGNRHSGPLPSRRRAVGMCGVVTRPEAGRVPSARRAPV